MPYIPGIPGIDDVYHSPNVFANFVPIALWNDPEGTDAATLANIMRPSYTFDVAATEAIEGDADSPVAVETAQKKLIEQGVLDPVAIEKGTKATPTQTDTAPPASTTTPVTTGTVAVGGSVDNTLLCGKAQGLSQDYYVKTVTKNVTFPYDVATVAPENGMTVQEVCDNLRLMIINCFDPIKKQYPDAFMTCSFRRKGVGSPTSQHPKGMACDIQFAKKGIPDYYAVAQWVKDNTVYDQFLLEYKNTPHKHVWLHLSFNKAGNRKQVCTFINDKNCKGPGVTGLYDLSGSL